MKRNTPAQTTYEVAVEHLQKFCEKETELQPIIRDEQYPVQVQFIPKPQLTVFGNENIDENGEVNDLTVTVGLSTDVKSTLKFKMDSKLLKKLIKLAETVGSLYYHAFREEQGDRITPTRPVMKAMDGFDADMASELCCPGCGHPVVNQWAKGTNPKFCQGCGQALDWTPEPTEDAFEEGLEKLRRKLDEAKEAEQ